MKYLFLVFYDEKNLDALSEQESQDLTDAALEYDNELRKGGHFVTANALAPVSAASTVRVRNGKVIVTDGPFAETNEQIGGFLLIEARDLNEAIQLASKVPPIRMGGIEVRPIKELRHSSAK
ncbi:MAG TPA: YciI family protein [Terracidiphilus sp.]|nr:YciI family protein [Terracidiphilus sp.]